MEGRVWTRFLPLVLALGLLTGSSERNPERPGSAPDSLALRWLRMLAREDTLELPQYLYARIVRSREARPTLEEILGWCIEGERKRWEGVQRLVYRERIRTLLLWGEEADTSARRVAVESLREIRYEPPGEPEIRELGERRWDSREGEEESSVRVRVRSSARRLTDLPFFFRNLGAYEFQILRRRILADRILYRIGFRPRSEFDPLPEGWFLVDTRDYQILHAEFSWTENVPFPLLLESVDKVVMTRRRVDGVWFPERTLVLVRLRKLPLVDMPRRVEVEIRAELVEMEGKR
jgi:hypothetical protein